MDTPKPGSLARLGPARPGPTALADIAAAAAGQQSVRVATAEATGIEMPVLNMTTGGLWRVQGAATPGDSTGQDVPFSAVVKILQSPLLWQHIDQVPPHMREELARRYPWRTEAEVYASNLGHALPPGGRLPEIYSVIHIDPQRMALWMEDVLERPGAAWTDATFASAAHWLGRLAGSSAVANLGPQISAARDADRLLYYLDGVGRNVFIPGIEGDDMWRVPAVACAATPGLITGLRALAGRAYQLADELAQLPAFPAHGDASPQNLLIENGPEGTVNFVVIDWGMYGDACAGFDLGQLLSGWVNEGAMRGRDLYRLEPLCLSAYCDGLAKSGVSVAESVVRRGHALSMALFTGLSAVASDRLGEPDSAELRHVMAGRLEMAQFVLDLLADTD
ncbi:phosphotransferase [Arthrobacter sp. HLT1-20]